MKNATHLAGPRRVAFGLLLALLAVTAVSCGKKSDRKAVFQVSGKLVDGGQPAAKAMLIFHPVKDAESRSLRPVGKVADDGSFRLSTYTANDGAPAGQYAVTVVWPTVPKDAPPDLDEGPDRLEGRCNNPKKSPWRITVEEKANDLGALDLNSWPKPASSAPKASARQKSPAVMSE